MSQFDDERTMPVTNAAKTHTKKLAAETVQELDAREVSELDSHGRPWRVAMTLLDFDVQIVVDLDSSIVMGRSYPQTELFPGVDLSPFDAYQRGVSRHHAVLQLEDQQVVIRDNGSANGTLLNGKRIRPDFSYPLRNGDIVSLAKMQLKFELLYNPLDVRPQ